MHNMALCDFLSTIQYKILHKNVSRGNLEVNFFCLGKTRIVNGSLQSIYRISGSKVLAILSIFAKILYFPPKIQSTYVLLYQDCSWRKIMKFLAIYEKFLMDFWQDLNYYTLEPLASYKCFGYSLILDVQMWNNVIYDEFEY